MLEMWSGLEVDMSSGAEGENSVPGASVRLRDLKEVVRSTGALARQIARFCKIRAQLLRDKIPQNGGTTSVSEALVRLDTKAIMAELRAAHDWANDLANRCPERASELRSIQTQTADLETNWREIINADRDNDEVQVKLSVVLRGPKGTVGQIMKDAHRAIDNAIITALVETPFGLGLDPESGRLLVLNPEDPQRWTALSITGDALLQRVRDLGGEIVADSEVQAFLARVRSSPIS